MHFRKQDDILLILRDRKARFRRMQKQRLGRPIANLKICYFAPARPLFWITALSSLVITA